MAISDAAYADWLADTGKERCVLIEATHSSGTEYIGSSAFVSSPSDTPANTAYDDILLDVPEVNSSIDGEVTFGKAYIDNSDGVRDSWLTRNWVGWPLKYYLGAPDWDRDDFRLIVSGTNAGISSSSPAKLEFEIRDKRELLQEVVQTTLLDSEEVVPISLGTIFNAVPRVNDAANLIYQFHEDGNASVTDVRVNGNTVAYTDNSDGTFTLAASPSGFLTCDITGDTDGTAEEMVEWLALRSPEISSSDIDSTNLAAFPATYGLGLYIRDQRTIAECIDDVMSSVGGVARFSRLGLLQIVRLEAPGTSVLSLVEDDVIERGLSVSEQEEPYKRVTLGYKKNWGVQDAGSIAGVVSAANRDLYSSPYSTVSSDNSSITTNHPLALTPDTVETLIVSSTNAQTEADRRKTLRGSKRTQYRLEGFGAPFQVQIGQTITLTHSRFGFSSGQTAVVVGISQQPTRNRITLDLWR